MRVAVRSYEPSRVQEKHPGRGRGIEPLHFQSRERARERRERVAFAHHPSRRAVHRGAASTLLALCAAERLTVQVEQVFADWARQTLRLCRGDAHVEIEYTVGPIAVEEDVSVPRRGRALSPPPHIAHARAARAARR